MGLYLRPSSLYDLGLLNKLGCCDTCGYLLGSLTILGTLQFLVVAARLWSQISPLSDLDAVGRQLIEAFPADLEINLTNGVLTSNRPGPVWIDIPSFSILDLRSGSTAGLLVSLNFGSPDMQDLGRLGLAALSYYVDLTPNLRVLEFEIGDAVEVLVDRDLLACGAPRSFLPPPWGGHWLPAVVHSVRPSTFLSKFRYLVTVGTDPPSSKEVPECSGLSLQDCTCSVATTALRRKSYVLVDWEKDWERSLDELQSSKALLVLGSRSFADFEGFSFHHGLYWSHRQTTGGRVWQRYGRTEIRADEQLSSLVSIYCNVSDAYDLRCSQKAATANFESLLEVDSIKKLVRFKMTLPFVLFLLWFGCVLGSVLCRGLQILVFWPFGYVAYAMLRHVDTPNLSICRSLVVVVYTTMPWVFASCSLELLWQMWSDGEHLHPQLRRLLELEWNEYRCLFWSWLLYSSFMVIRLRALATFADLQGLLGKRRPPEPGLEDEDSQPTCRICFGGSESGRLISPCLCSGTMRFVHMDCLNMWRFRSANPQSSFRCDQCHFQYSVQRALYANILRSALVLHTLTLLVFGGVVILCAYICHCIHWFHHGDADYQLFSDNFVEQVTNISGLLDDDKEELAQYVTKMNEFSIFGIPFVHLLHGLTMVGMSGCNWLIFFLAQRVTTGAADWDSNPLPVISGVFIIAGLFRVFFSLYRFGKLLSGKVLESAAGMILDIRAAAVAPKSAPADKGGRAVGEAKKVGPKDVPRPKGRPDRVEVAAAWRSDDFKLD